MTQTIEHSSESRMATATPRRFMGQLCKHFEHKLPVTLADTAGRIAFASGTCTLVAEEAFLALRVTTTDPAALPGLEDVVERHLKRFAFREKLELSWVRVTPPEAG